MKKLLEKKWLLAICGGVLAAVILTVVLVYNLAVLPNQRYETATRLFEAGNYAEAYEAIQKVPETKDDAAQLLPYYEAYSDFSAGEYASAAQEFEALGDYEDSLQMAAYCKASDLMERKEYSEAYNAFSALGDFRDSQDMLQECPYRMAQELMASGDFAGAQDRFSVLTGYKDSDAQAQECSYQLALAALERKEYGEAYNAFSALGDYNDSVEMLSECRYRMAGDLMAAGDLAGALERYDTLTGYKDSDTQAKECRYQQAVALETENTVESLTQAVELYTQIGEYKDAPQKVTDTSAALEAAKRVPYTPSSEAFFDVDCKNPAYMMLRPYKFAVYGNNNNVKIISIPNMGAFFKLKLGSVWKYPDSNDSDGASLGSSPISSSNSFLDGRYRVTGTWSERGSAQFTSSSSGALLCSAVRWGNTAIYIDGKYDEYSLHKKFISNALSGKVVKNDEFSGMVGGAVVFGDYEYIDLSGMRFSEADSLDTGHNGHTYQEPVISTTSGVEINFRNSCTSGDLTETYNGIDIYTLQSDRAYIHIKPDIYILCVARSGNVVEARQTLRTLIDNYHRP